MHSCNKIISQKQYLVPPVLPWTAWVRWCPPVLLLSWTWFSHSLCADVLSLSCPYMSFRISMYTSSIPCSCKWCQYCLRLYWVECLLVIHESNTQWYVVFTALLFKLVYGMYVICRRVLAPKSCLISRLIYSLAVMICLTVCTYLIASKLVCCSWCIFCSPSWKISPYFLPFVFWDASFCYALCV